jgi:hypothetical protein
MTLGWKLFVVFLGFLALIAVVMVLAFRERKAGRAIAPGDLAAGQAQDSRVLAVVFSAMVGGMLLTLVVAWLVFL